MVVLAVVGSDKGPLWDFLSLRTVHASRIVYPPGAGAAASCC